MTDAKWIIWENHGMSLQAAFDPAIPMTEGFHIVLLQKKGLPSPWADPDFFGRMMMVAARASKAIMELKMADWVNIHYDGNIGAAEGKPKLHIHIFGRYKTGKKWGGPLNLPFGAGPYGNDPLADQGIERLRSALTGYVLP